MRVGITGHQRLQEPARWGWVKRELDGVISSLTLPLTGITSLAIGTDQLFANAVLQRGGSLEIIIPFAGYESTFSEEHDRQEYLRLLRLALKQEVLEKYGSDEEAYLASGKRMVDQSELLIAVWDGQPAVGLGGTGDVVSYAVQQRKRTIHLNPITQQVEEL
jgi:hypothetical protein